MLFTPLPLAGSTVIDVEKREDHRGFYMRTWCQREFESAGLVSKMVQTNVIVNHSKGTLRGLHYQTSPYAEAKLFRCTRGAIYDVIVDLRPESPTYLRWVAVTLRAESYQLLYVPEHFAQGFLTLEDNTEVTYQVSEFYSPGHEAGACYDDPAFGIHWPAPVSVISDKDRNWPAFQPDGHLDFP